MRATPSQRLVKKARPSAPTRAPCWLHGTPANRRPTPLLRKTSPPAGGRGARSIPGFETVTIPTQGSTLSDSGKHFALIGRLETAQDRIAALHGFVQSLLDAGLVGEDLLKAVRQLAADLQEAAETNATRTAAGRFHVQRCDGGLTALIGRLVVEAIRLHVVEARLGDGYVAGHGRPEERLLRLGDEVQEGSRRLIFLRRVALEDPERGAADEGVVPLGAVIDRQHGDVPMHAGIGGAADVAVIADRGQRHLAMAGGEGGDIILAGVRRLDLGEAIVVPTLEVGDELHEFRLVEGELGVEAAEAVVLRGNRLAMHGRELLHQLPALVLAD